MMKFVSIILIYVTYLVITCYCYSPFQSKKLIVQKPQYLDRQPRNNLQIVYQWRILDFQYNTIEDRENAINSGDYIPQNNLPLGIDVWRNRLFVTMPRWKNGVPASLGWLPLPPSDKSLPLNPYPDWDSHSSTSQPDCNKLMSVYRTFIDECERLWVIDAGIVNATILANQLCPPKIVVFDLVTDTKLFQYEIPPAQVRQDSLFTNLIVDIREGQCDDAHAYITDVWRYGLIVFSLRVGRSWRTQNHLFQPTPTASNYNLHGLNYQWIDGIFGITLSPIDNFADRTLFFHPMSSYTEFTVLTSVLRNETVWLNGGFMQPLAFIPIGSRGPKGQAATCGIDRYSVIFYSLVQQDAVGCWDIRKPYTRENLGIIDQNTTTMIFPNDLKVDQENVQSVWVITNRLPVYLYSQLNFNDVNFRILRGNVNEVVKGTPCDPNVPAFPPVYKDCN